LTNPPIGEALAADGGEQHVVALAILNTELGAAVVAEVEFGKVAV
jgi:hypothetical protein